MLLDVRGLSKYFHGLAAVDQVDMHIGQGEILAIIGPNGAGKSTLFNCITNTVPITRGSISWKGTDITNIGPHSIAQRGIIRSFQHTSLFPNLTVVENVLIGRHRLFKGKFWKTMVNAPSTKKEEYQNHQAARRILGNYGLLDKGDRLAKSLSFGEMRHLQIALCMGASPELLLLDEPAAGLNPEETRQLMELIKDIQHQGVTVCLVEHDMKFVMGLCDRVIVLDAGRKIAEGTPTEIQSNELVIKVYLGGSHLA
jgi:branched-chain amino acid transport system ATP-binding protein